MLCYFMDLILESTDVPRVQSRYGISERMESWANGGIASLGGKWHRMLGDWQQLVYRDSGTNGRESEAAQDSRVLRPYPRPRRTNQPISDRRASLREIADALDRIVVFRSSLG